MENALTTDIEKLSARESEVLTLLCNGFSRDLIAETMGISKLTYDSYRKSIRAKLDIKNQSDWAQVLYRNS
jgi:DNA-binding CsgD family transcriptional regulator